MKTTPQEQAQHLVDTHRMVLMQEDTDCGNEILCTTIAIKMALITVETTILQNPGDTTASASRVGFWRKVRSILLVL